MDRRTHDINVTGQPEHSDRIKRDIDRTRMEMDHTLDELGNRLRPRRLLDELMDYVLGSTGRDGEGMSETSAAERVQETVVRYGGKACHAMARHPLPTALLGAGVACWIMESQRRASAHEYEYESGIVDEECEFLYGESYQGGEAGDESQVGRRMMSRARGAAGEAGGKISAAASSAASGVKSAAHTAQDAVTRAGSGLASATSQAAHTLGDASSRVATGAGRMARKASRGVSHLGPAISHSVSSAGHTVSQGISTASHSVSRGVKQGSRQVADAMHEYPLASAAALCGIGIGLGLLLPATRREDRWFGDSSDQVKHKAKEAGQRVMEQGREVATAGVTAAAHAIERETSQKTQQDQGEDHEE